MENPKKIGKYEIIAPLGKGAMGMVYKAFDAGIGRSVALKVIHRHIMSGDAGEMAVSRFRREAQTAGRLIHPHIVAIFEYGEDEGLPYIAMEYVEGVDLRRILKQYSPMPLHMAAEIVKQLLDALGYAHTRGVIHRDVKPANVLRMESGLIKVMDFGIARLDNSNLTQTGTILGSPSYMSPEQVTGQKVDGRSDLFSAGVLFYELLTREKIFQAGTLAATMHKILHTQPEDPAFFNPDVPSSVYPLLLKALAKKPEERFQDAESFQRAIQLSLESGMASTDPSVPSVPSVPSISRIVSPITEPARHSGSGTTTGMAPRPGGQTVAGSTLTQFPTTIAGDMSGFNTTLWRRGGQVYLPVPIDELPIGSCNVDLYLTFNGNFVLFRGKNLPMDESVRNQWQETGIDRVFIRRENFGDFLSWAMKKTIPQGHPNIQLLYLQERLYPIDRNLLVDGMEPQFSLYAFSEGQLMPVMFPDAPNIPRQVDQRYLRQFPQLYIHLRDLGAFLEYLHKQWAVGATKIPMNKRGAVIAREKMRMAALSVFCSAKVGDAIQRARRTVDDIIHMITGNPDTYHAMLAVSDLDANTYIHSANVMVMSVGLGVAMGWGREQLHILGMGALLHDIGKREIPRELLLKKGAITPQEYEALKEHVLMGIQFCRSQPEIPDLVTRIVAEHHEKLDGSGYPRGITGRAIGEMSQVVAIMEVYDALTTHQPFRKAMLPAQAFRKLRSYDKSFNQEYVEIFFQQVGASLPRL